MNDHFVVDFLSDEEHMNGDVMVTAGGGLPVFALPTNGIYVLYYDPEICCWIVDRQDNLWWNGKTQSWEPKYDPVSY